MTIKSKWPKLGTLLLAGFVLAACGDNGQDNQTQEENAPSNGEEASSEETSGEATDQEGSDDQASNEETVEITFWHAMNGPHQEALTALTDEFNESQDQYFVNEQSQGEYGDLNQSVTAAAVSDELPTMAQLTPTDVPEWASNDLIVPLTDDFLTSNGLDQEAIDDIYPGFLESGTFDGERYAMPFSKSTRIMFYNQDILDEYGVEVPETWDQVLDLADQMIEGGDDAYAMGLENNFEMEWETMARQNGSDFVDPDSGTVDLNGPEAVEALELIQGMLEDGQARTAGEDGFMSGPFGNGASALYIGSSAGTTHVAPAAEGINWSTAPIPTFNDTELTLFAGNDLGLFSSASEEEQAGFVAYLSFLLEPENAAQWAIDTGYVPVREEAINSDRYQNYLEENPEYEAPTQMLSYGMSSPTFEGYGEFRNNMVTAMEEVSVNGVAAQDALDTLQEQTEQILN